MRSDSFPRRDHLPSNAYLTTPGDPRPPLSDLHLLPVNGQLRTPGRRRPPLGPRRLPSREQRPPRRRKRPLTIELHSSIGDCALGSYNYFLFILRSFSLRASEGPSRRLTVVGRISQLVKGYVVHK